MSNEPKEIRYKINREPLFDATLSNGPHKQTLSDGITVEAHVEVGASLVTPPMIHQESRFQYAGCG
jgi:hypothetical protein